MNQENEHGHSILGSLFSIADQLEPLHEIKNPKIAAICGFFGGGVALGIYLRSLKDFLIPWGILFVVLILGVITFEMALILVPVLWAAYGYYRTKTSNAALLNGKSSRHSTKAEVVCPPPIPTRQNRPYLKN